MEALQASAAWTVLFGGCHGVLSHLWPRVLGPASRFTHLSRKERVLCSEKVCSTLNGCLSGGLALYLLAATDLWQHNVLQPYNETVGTILACYTGYSIYDMLTMLYTREHWSLWVHHFAGALGAFSMMVYKQAAFFPIAVMISEITVVPVNWVWFLRTCGVGEATLHMKLAKLVRAILFLSLRAPIVPWAIYYALQRYRDPKTSYIDLDAFWADLASLPLPVLVGVTINLCLFGGLNLFWTLGAMTAVKSKKTRKQK